MVLAVERLEQIADHIRRHRTASIWELSEKLGTSEATIRRDLAKLEKQGYLRRVRGGAVALSPAFPDIPFEVRVQQMVAEKRAIAQAAAALVAHGETIAIDSGSTAACFARALRNHRALTVVTNSERVAHALYDCPDVSVIATGGLFLDISRDSEGRPQRGDVVMAGPVALETLRRFRPDKTFLGTAGITIADGMSNRHLSQAEIKRLMAEIGKEVILLSDHTKFGQTTAYLVAPVHVLDRVVTDSGLEAEYRTALEERGIDVIVAEPSPEHSADSDTQC
jgi:DeoR family transcriptional regulator of aga operon/DeoR family fructose operon transcriptional repressor